MILALTGEKIIPDIASWQTMMDKAHSQSEQFLHDIETMNTKLLEIETQCKVGCPHDNYKLNLSKLDTPKQTIGHYNFSNNNNNFATEVQCH